MKAISLPIRLYGQGGSGVVALGSLNRYQMSFLIDILHGFYRNQSFRPAADPPGDKSHRILPAIPSTADTDDFFQRIIGFAYRGQQFVSRS